MIYLALQFLSYGVLGWAIFLGLSYFLARLIGWPGIFLAHIIIAFVVLFWDISWVRQEMQKPEWKETGTPDLDMIFMFGVLIRVVVINLLVTPLGIWGFRRRRAFREKKSTSSVGNEQTA